MSVIVAIKKDDVVYFGADSQVTRGCSRMSLSNPNNYKIWKVRGVENCLMGSVGSIRDSCVIRVMDSLVREIDAIHGEVDFDYMVKRIEPMIRDELKEHEFIEKDNPYSTMDSRFIFAFKDKLFTLEYGAVIEHDDYVAIGSGECEAIGSLLSSEDNENPKDKIIKAIKSSAAHDIYVDYPIILSDTKTTEFEIIKDK